MHVDMWAKQEQKQEQERLEANAVIVALFHLGDGIRDVRGCRH